MTQGVPGSRRRDDAKTMRQRELARWIGATYHNTDKLMPLGRHGSFGILPRAAGFWIDERVSDLAWQSVARRFSQQADQFHVIDHAWIAGFSEQPHESWALVLEPYLSSEDIADRIISHFAAIVEEEWPLTCAALRSDQSSWNPGNCYPLVFTFVPGCMERFVKAALRWWLDH
jgi:hypothetical protein